MNRWRKTLLTSLAVVAAGALTLGAGTVSGGSSGQGPDSVILADRSSHDDDRHERDRHRDHDVRIWRFGSGPWLGVVIEEVTAERAEELRLDEARGALVTHVEKDSPAERAGIRKGDVIVEFDGERIPGVRSLLRVVQETPEGRQVGIDLLREGRSVSVEAEIEERASSSAGPGVFYFGDDDHPEITIDIPDIDFDFKNVIRLAGRQPRLGVGVDRLTPQLSEYFGVDRDDGGLLVNKVYEETPAEAAGLKAGDVILEADGQRIENVLDLRQALKENAGKTISILILRNKSELSLEVTLEEADDGEWEEGRSLHRLERREMKQALREAKRVQREAMQVQRKAMRQYRDEMRQLRELEREKRQTLPYSVIRKSGAVEI